jgi:thiol-disulfide isomerase/thioredoxin
MRKLLLLAMLCPLLGLSQSDKITPLIIGDTIPDIALSNIINYKTQSANLSSFKSKLLILDFWATWCTSCLKHFPKMDSLQQQYEGKLKVLLVNSKNTGGTKEKVLAFIKKKNLTLPSLVEDSLLLALFPHQLLPHYVWIDSAGKVLAITGADEISASNINSLLSGSPLLLSMKKDVMNYDPSRPLFNNGNGGSDTALLFQTSFTGMLQGMGGGYRKTFTNTHKKYTWLNQPLLSLYHAAAGFEGNKVLLEVKDQSRFINPHASFQAWTGGVFSYEILAPQWATENQLRSILWQDLDRYLFLHSRYEMRTIECWSLVRTGKDNFTSKGGPSLAQWYSKEYPCNTLQNLPLSRLLDVLNLQLMGEPIKPVIIDETGYAGLVDINLSCPLDDLPALKKELLQYGLDLILTKKKLKLFVISEK